MTGHREGDGKERFAICEFDESNLDHVTRVHMWAFKDHLNTQLGTIYVKAFLQWFLINDGCIRVVGYDENRTIQGYTLGAPWGYQEKMNRDLSYVAAVEIAKRPWLFFQKKIVDSIRLRVAILARLNSFVETTSLKYEGKIVSLVSIGVSEMAQGTGLATRLMEKFVEDAKRKDYDVVRLSVHRSNNRARGFYEKMGWTPEKGDLPVMGYFLEL
jgi:ribosomal protein S18 acetylase RimI-like enzyme